jgi:hypothetical protein
LLIHLESIQVDEEDHLVRSGMVILPKGGKVRVAFSARHDDNYHNRKHWYGLCGACGQRTTKLYLELVEVPVCASCGRVRYVTESVTPSQRPRLAALKAQLQVEADPEETKLNWRLRRAAALRVTWAEREKPETMT